jgi:hypothetical protein
LAIRRRNQSQQIATTSIAKVESAVAVLCKEGASLDINDIKVAKSLYDLVHVMYMNNASHTAWGYYLSESADKKLNAVMKDLCVRNSA